MAPPDLQLFVVGSGPAGLMAATVLSDLGFKVDLFEKRPGLGRKLLVAGSSGLNISHDLPLPDFARMYTSPSQPDFFSRNLGAFDTRAWVTFIEKRLGMETFLGTSNRYFVREMKASTLLKRWVDLLEKQGVRFFPKSEWLGVECVNDRVQLAFRSEAGSESRTYSGGIFAMGGASWETETPSWIEKFSELGIGATPFEPSNVGYEVAWPQGLLKEATRQPLKNIVLRTSRGEKAGELLITEYGLEGTPIYFLGVKGGATIDLKPGLTTTEMLEKLQVGKENLSPIRRVDRKLGLCPASFALVFHLAPPSVKSDLEKLAAFVKKVPIELLRPRPLSEAISSRGGVLMSELDQGLQLKKFPRIHLAGEMLDWDAPTGGFLIQGSVLQGFVAATSLARQLRSSI